MKKTTLIAASILIIALSASAQKKENVVIPTQKANIDTVTLDSKIKAVVIDSTTINVGILRDFIAQSKANKVPIFATLEWVVLNWQFIKKASNPGLNDEQMDKLKEPLLAWVQYVQNLQRQQNK